MDKRGNQIAYYFSKKVGEELEKKSIFTKNMLSKFDELNKNDFNINTVDKTVDNSVDKMKRV